MFRLTAIIQPKTVSQLKSAAIAFGALTVIGLIGYRLFRNVKNQGEKITQRLSRTLYETYDCNAMSSQLILEKLKPLVDSPQYHDVLDRFIQLSEAHIKKGSLHSGAFEHVLAEDDAVIKAPEYHDVLYENNKVRILWGLLLAGHEEPLHRHYWPSLLVMIAGTTFDIEYADKTKEREECPIGVSFLPPDTQAASYKNSDSTCGFLRFEIKP